MERYCFTFASQYTRFPFPQDLGLLLNGCIFENILPSAWRALLSQPNLAI